MLDARVEPLLHPARQDRVAQHDQRGALDVVHVDPAAFALELGELGDQRAAQARHALLVRPGFVLLASRGHAQHQFLRLSNGGDADDLFAEFARRAFFGQQRDEHRGHVLRRQGLLQLHALGRKSRRAGVAQRAGGVPQRLLVGRNRDQIIFRRGQPGKLGKLHAKGPHRGVDHAFFIGQRELGSLIQCGPQRLIGLKAAMRLHHGFEIGLQRRIGQQRCIKAPPHQRTRRRVVFQQLVIDRQAQSLQHRHRRAAQQRRKPAVKGTNLHRTPAGQHGAV